MCCCVMLCGVTRCSAMLCHVVSWRVICCYVVMLCFVLPYPADEVCYRSSTCRDSNVPYYRRVCDAAHVLVCAVLSWHVLLRCIMRWHAGLCCGVMSCCGVVCLVMICDGMICAVVLCHVRLRCDMV